MSVCGRCPWPNEVTDEDIEDNPAYFEEDGCPEFGCSHEDAAYRAQSAYWRLYEKYEKLEKDYNELLAKNRQVEDDGK